MTSIKEHKKKISEKLKAYVYFNMKPIRNITKRKTLIIYIYEITNKP